MTQVNPIDFSSLANELSELGKLASALGKKFELLASLKKVKSVRVSPKTHPALFDKKLIRNLKVARKEFAKGSGTDYMELRRSLGLK